MNPNYMNKAINIFKENRSSILGSWVQTQLAEQVMRDDLIDETDLYSESDEFFNSFVDNLSDDSISTFDHDSFFPAKEILSGISLARTKKGFSARETGFYINSLKQVLLSCLKKELTNADELYEQSTKVSQLIDGFGVITFESFIQGRENIITRQRDDLDELTTPVLKVWDGILALPIIGTLDSSRAESIMENMLHALAKTGYSLVILDISGVPAVDSMVALHLMKTVQAIRLMGGQCVISGIRPEIAQSMVQGGIDMTGIPTKATLASAIKTCFDLLRLQVVKK
jgi:rsbT co-antagonist protein RsbR